MKLPNRWEEAGKLHILWHELCDYLKKYYYRLDTRWSLQNFKKKKMEFRQTTRKYRELDLSKVTGYQAMERMRKFIKKYPEILVVGCDDDHFCSSDIYLIPHESEDYYMGTTFMFIPQCTDSKDTLFLYPSHLYRLMDALREITERQCKKPGTIEDCWIDFMRRDVIEETEEGKEALMNAMCD